MNQEKFRENKFSLSFSFFILALILGAAFFLLFIGSFKYYRSGVSVIFIPKNETMSIQTPYVMENLIRLPRMLAFYERMIGENSNIVDEFSEKEKDEKKKLWNKMLEIKKDDGSSIINIEAASRNKDQSAALANQTARTLFNTASFYYNIKTDADFRIIEKTATTAILKYWYWLAILSIIFGLASSFVLNSLFLRFVDMLEQREHKIKPKKEDFEEKKDFGVIPEEARQWVKKNQAPENLPVFPEDETIPERPVETYEEEIFERNEPEKLSEPTEDELKKRLNQLLRGEL